MSARSSALFLLASCLLSIFSANFAIAAERRVALVIGNGAYESVPRLENPTNDADAVAASLRRAGFEVSLVKNVSREKLVNALRTFGAVAETSDWALVFYAGHGIEMGGVNYMLPVDARLAVDRDLQFEGVPMSQALASVEGARKLRLLILDACRDNPFAAKMVRTAGASRSIGRGLAKVEPDSGTLVAYSAKDGQVAQDGDGRNSPFSVALVRNIDTPGLELNRLFRRVTSDVLKSTNRRQEPYTYGSLPDEDFYFQVPRATEPEAALPPSASSQPEKPDRPVSPAVPAASAVPSVSPSIPTKAAAPSRRRGRAPTVASIDPRPASVSKATRRAANPMVRRRAQDRAMIKLGYKRSGQPGFGWHKSTNCQAGGGCALND